MTFSVGILWGIYILVVVISFAIFWLLLEFVQHHYRSVSYGTAFFIASLFGALSVFIGAAWLDANQLTDTDKAWLSVLFILAFLLPIFIIIYIIWVGEYSSFTEEGNCLPGWCKKDPCKKDPCKKKSYSKKKVHCDNDTGICHIQKQKIYDGDDKTTIVYSRKKEFEY